MFKITRWALAAASVAGLTVAAAQPASASSADTLQLVTIAPHVAYKGSGARLYPIKGFIGPAAVDRYVASIYHTSHVAVSDAYVTVIVNGPWPDLEFPTVSANLGSWSDSLELFEAGNYSYVVEIDADGTTYSGDGGWDDATLQSWTIDNKLSGSFSVGVTGNGASKETIKAKRRGTTVTLTGSASYIPKTFVAAASHPSAQLKSTALYVQANAGHGWKNIKKFKTGGNGAYKVGVTVRKTEKLRIYHPAQSKANKSYSPAVKVE